MARETMNRPIADQPHDPAKGDLAAGWYRHPEREGLWYWTGKEWTGEHMVPLDFEGGR